MPLATGIASYTLSYTEYMKIQDVNEAVRYYDLHAAEFAKLADDEHRNWYEYTVNWPSIEQLTSELGGMVLDYGCGDAVFTEKLLRPDRKDLWDRHITKVAQFSAE